MIERTGTSAKVYFHTAAGDVLRVHDAIYRAGKRTLFVPPPSGATSRIFVGANRERRVYHFTRDEKHQLTVPFDPATRAPR